MSSPEVRPKSFGKRGVVAVQGRQPMPGTPPESQPAASTGVMGLPKWAIGAAAAVFLMILVSGGGMAGGGLAGGLLGGLLAGKLFAGNSGGQAARPASSADPSATSETAQRTVLRSGFGSTGRSSGFSGGG